MTELNITSLENALNQLQKSLDYTNSDLAKNDPDIAYQFQMASIQAFEYSYELACKMLKRYLKMTASSQDKIDEMAFSDIIRTGSDKGLLKNGWHVWKEYRHCRNLTSHSYDEKKAQEVFTRIPDFYQEAVYLLNQLTIRTNDTAS